MGVISVETKYGPLNFSIKGDTPSSAEQLKIQDVLIDKESYFSEEDIQNYQKTQKGESVNFDYETGVQDSKLRSMLGRADTKQDQDKVLRERFNLLETEYTRDQFGNLALMPEGAQKFGIETDKPIIIDEKGNIITSKNIEIEKS